MSSRCATDGTCSWIQRQSGSASARSTRGRVFAELVGDPADRPLQQPVRRRFHGALAVQLARALAACRRDDGIRDALRRQRGEAGRPRCGRAPISSRPCSFSTANAARLRVAREVDDPPDDGLLRILDRFVARLAEHRRRACAGSRRRRCSRRAPSRRGRPASCSSSEILRRPPSRWRQHAVDGIRRDDERGDEPLVELEVAHEAVEQLVQDLLDRTRARRDRRACRRAARSRSAGTPAIARSTVATSPRQQLLERAVRLQQPHGRGRCSRRPRSRSLALDELRAASGRPRRQRGLPLRRQQLRYRPVPQLVASSSIQRS
jgi:hypothetical protein